MRTLNRMQEFARENRKNPTPSEDLLYSALLTIFSPYQVVLVSQEIIGPYIADFCIYPSRVVVEVDGSYHNSAKQRAYDGRRDVYMRNMGLKVIRFSARDVEGDAKEIAERVLRVCGQLVSVSEPRKPIVIPPQIHREWAVHRHDAYKSEFIAQKNGIRKRRVASLSKMSGIVAVTAH